MDRREFMGTLVAAGATLEDLGSEFGKYLASSVVDGMPKWSDTGLNFSDAMTEMVAWSFKLGEVFGPFVIDILLTFLGVSFLDIGIKLVGKTIESTATVVPLMETSIMWLTAWRPRFPRHRSCTCRCTHRT